MNTETRDAQFAMFVDQLTDSLTLTEVSFRFGVLEAIGSALVAVYQAFATAEPGQVTRAATGLAL